MLKIDDADMAGKWERLAARDVREACEAALARFDPARSVYSVDFIGERLDVDVKDRSVGWSADSAARRAGEPKRDAALLALEYLANARPVPSSGKWVTGRQLPSGDFFFRGPHEVPSELIVKRFGRLPEEFLEKAKALGGVEVKGPGVPGDATALFRVLPRVEMMIVLWKADDEFPARATLLFDATISEHLQLDGVFLAAMVLVLSLIRA